MPAADFAFGELMCLPRNLRSHRLYGLSPVEQIALTINIALRRDQATLDYLQHRQPAGFLCHAAEGMDRRSDKTVPGLFRRSPANASIRLGMAGNLARRRMVKFMPAEFKLTETRQSPLKDRPLEVSDTSGGGGAPESSASAAPAKAGEALLAAGTFARSWAR